MAPDGQRNQEPVSVLTLLLLKLACCGIPLLILILGAGGLGLAGSFFQGYGDFVLIGIVLASSGYWLWRRKRQKGCCSRDTNG